MGTVKDICWSSKYRKQLLAKVLKAEETREPADVAKLVTSLSRSSHKLKCKKQESCHNIIKKLVDNLQLFHTENSNTEGKVSQVSLCLKPCSRPNVEDFSKLDQCCPADDCPLTKQEKTNQARKKMCRRKKSPCTAECPAKKPDPCPPEPKEQCCSKEPVKEKCCSKEPVKEKCCSKELAKEQCCPTDPCKEKCCPKEQCIDKCCHKKKGKCFVPDSVCEPRPQRKKVKGMRSKATSSICVINESAKANCCACCCLLAEYFKEILRLFCIKNDTRISEIFCELCDVAGCICNDCLNFLKKLMHCLCNLSAKCC